MSVTINYKNDTLATFRKATKTLTTKGKYLEDNISITDDTTNGSVYQDDDGYVVINDEDGSGLTLLPLNVTENGTYRTNSLDAGYSPVTVNVHTDPTLQSKTVTPTESSQTVKPDTNYDGLSQVTVGAISNTYIGTSVPKMAATNLTVSGSTITAPAGYYASAVSKNVEGGTATTPGTNVTTNPTITLSKTTGIVTASYNSTKSITPTVSAGYITAGTAGTVRYSGTATYSLSTQAAKTVTPTETAQTVVNSGYFTTGDVKVAGISSNYVGTGITKVSASDLTHSGPTVTAPAGYYSSALTHTIDNGSAVTPATTLTFAPAISVDAATGKITATVSGSSNITPTVTAGYVNAGTAGKITVSGSKTLTMSTKAGATITPTETAQTVVASGYYTLGDVKVAGISSTYVGTGVTTRSSANLTVNGATVTAPAGYYSAAAAATVATATQASPTVTISNTTGKITATLTENTGYITGGTTTGTLQLTSVAGTTITPTEAQQTAVARYRWTKGSVYVAGISSTYVGTGVPTGSATNLTANGSTVTVPSGYYSSQVTKNVGAGTATTPTTTLTFAPAISVDAATGKITATVTGSSNITPTVSAGYISAGTAGKITVTGTSSKTLLTRAGTTITPTTASQLVISSGYYTTGSVYVGPMPQGALSNITIGDGQIGNITIGTSPVGVFSPAISVDPTTGIIRASFSSTISGIKPVATSGYLSTGATHSITVFGENGLQLSTQSGKFITPTYESQLAISAGYYATGDIAVGAIPIDYIIPSGTLNISKRGTYEVIEYASVITSIPGGTFVAKITNGGAYNNTRIVYNGNNYYSKDAIFDFIPGETATILTGSSYGGYVTIDGVLISSKSSDLRYVYTLPANNIDIYLNTGKPTESGYASITSSGPKYVQEGGDDIRWITRGISGVYTLSSNIVGYYAFAGMNNLIEIKTTLQSSIGISNCAFMECSNLKKVDLPLISQVGQQAFYKCSSLESFSASGFTILGHSAFVGCTALSYVNIPTLSTTNTSAFYGCSNLTEVQLPNLTNGFGYEFYRCINLPSITLPKLSSCTGYMFCSCSSLSYVSMPLTSIIGTSAFANCYSLSSIYCPAVVRISAGGFTHCSALSVIHIPSVCVSIQANAFTYCIGLESVYITGGNIPSLSQNAFSYTPIYSSSYLGYFGSIYVPQTLLESFKTATNWSYYSSRFVGLTDEQIAALG